MPKQARTPVADIVTLLRELESLCLDVACLDDAGLPVEHKAAVAKAKRIRERLRDQPAESKTKKVRGVTYYAVEIDGREEWVTVPESENRE